MTLSKNSPPTASAFNLDELLRVAAERQLQIRRQRELQEESKSSASDNEDSDSLSPSRLRSFTTASGQLPMQRQLQQESSSSPPGNDESDSLSSGRLHSLAAATRDFHSTNSMTVANLRSIVDYAIVLLDEGDEESEGGVQSNSDDDSNSHP
jgi:hypothetical protein